MSILIKGVDMPEPGTHTLSLQVYHDGTASIIGDHRYYKNEPFEVVPVPTPHGRLIDRDALSEFYRNQPYDPKLTEEELRREKIQRENIDLWVLNYIFDRDAPTIIEAEGADNG